MGNAPSSSDFDLNTVNRRRANYKETKLYRWVGVHDKTLWDFAQFIIALASAIIIPFVILFVGQQYTLQQQNSSIDQQHESILQAYITDMTTLLVDDQITSTLPEQANLSVDQQIQKNKIEEARTVAQAKTITALADLDSRRKSLLMQFLFQAGVFNYHAIISSKQPKNDIISLKGSDLHGVDLSCAALYVTDPNQTCANLAYINLEGANLVNSELNQAHFKGADLQGANLSGADLTGADFSNADLTNVTMTQQQLNQVKSADGAKLPIGLVPLPTLTPTPSSVSFSETTGGGAHTWSNYTNAGGTEGPIIEENTTIRVSCRIEGFKVADGNIWWYRIQSQPWNNAFYASADAFYNNGQTSGNLQGTPFYDPAIPHC